MHMNKVLIVDDAAFMRMAVKKVLDSNGLEVVGEAENGAIGFKKYIELKPDLVTMDITMPDMDGLESLRRIMAYDPNAKVVMLSAMGQEKMVREAVMLGAKSFIIKPFKDEHMMKTINAVLSM